MQVDEATQELKFGDGQGDPDYFSSLQTHQGMDPQSRNSTMISHYRIVLPLYSTGFIPFD
jgi:hypothetical protein